MELIKKLKKIQQELKVPKNQYNSFGKYNYRNCEDILEAVKPLLEKENLVLLLSDEIINAGDRYYIQATAKLCDQNENIMVNGYAREAENKKGMDEAQITGSASSYARKYALNGLFCIDDTKDADSMNNQTVNQPVKQQINQPTNQVNKCNKCGADMKISQAGSQYCSALCWKNATNTT